MKTCKMCGVEVFETDPELSIEHGSTVWSHVSGDCDDPTPVEEQIDCKGA